MDDGYCWTCGWPAADLDGGLDAATKMCAWCTEQWHRRAAARQPARDLS